MIDKEAEHGDSDGGSQRQLGGGRGHVLGTVEDHLEAETSVPGCIVSIVPCLKSSEPVLNGISGNSTGVGGCICAEYEFVSRKTEVGWHLFSFAEVEEVVYMA